MSRCQAKSCWTANHWVPTVVGGGIGVYPACCAAMLVCHGWLTTVLVPCVWRPGRSMAMVGQEPVLFARSIRENIQYGMEDEDVSLERCAEPSAPSSVFLQFYLLVPMWVSYTTHHACFPVIGYCGSMCGLHVCVSVCRLMSVCVVFP